MPIATSLKQFLSAPNNFTNLALIDQSLDYDACVELAEALKVNSTVTHIQLRNNQIGDKGLVALANGLKTNITMLTLNNNQIGNKGAISLAEALKHCNVNKHFFRLILDNNEIVDKKEENK